jgi:hypothetical protein
MGDRHCGRYQADHFGPCPFGWLHRLAPRHDGLQSVSRLGIPLDNVVSRQHVHRQFSLFENVDWTRQNDSWQCGFSGFDFVI